MTTSNVHILLIEFGILALLVMKDCQKERKKERINRPTCPK
jgi:hypothetical protein